jgi:hypothetical protein
LLLATLAYAFLLTLLAGRYEWLRLWLLRYYAHRTGKHCRVAKLPLTRLGCARSRLWQELPPNLAALAALSRQIQVTPVA